MGLTHRSAEPHVPDDAELQAMWDVEFDTANGHYPPGREATTAPMSMRWRQMIARDFAARYSHEERLAMYHAKQRYERPIEDVGC